MGNEEIIEITHSKKTMASFAFETFMSEFLWMAFSAFAFFYYETEIGLNVLLIGLVFVIYAIWSAVNDPLIGFFHNFHYSFDIR